MRTAWVIGSVLSLSAAAMASPNLQFETVINSGDAIAGDTFDIANQVVVDANGSVGIVGALTNSGNDVIIYSTPAAGDTWNNQAVAVGGQSYIIPSMTGPQEFNSFDNLAISDNPIGGTRLTFDASQLNGNTGILQYDVGSPSLGDVAFDGDTKGYSDVGIGGDDGGAELEMQVNGSGQAMFPAVSASKQVLVRGDESSVSSIFTSGGSLVSTAVGRVALAADNSGAAELSAGGVPGIYSIPANGGTPTEISGAFTPSTDGNSLIGYASGSGLNAALMLVNGTATRTQNIVLEKNGGTPQSILAGGQFTIPVGGPAPQGELTPNGQITVFVPSTTGNTIQYLNAASASTTAAVVASVYSGSGPVPSTAVARDPTGTNLDIEALPSAEGGTMPQINSGGTILFDGDVGTSPSNEVQALMDWVPGDTSPEILLKEGDQVNVGGSMVTVQDLFINNLSSDNDYYKNALNDQNDIAVEIDYTGGPNGSGTAVLYAAIPEPSTIALVSIAGIGLLARRRRR